MSSSSPSRTSFKSIREVFFFASWSTTAVRIFSLAVSPLAFSSSTCTRTVDFLAASCLSCSDIGDISAAVSIRTVAFFAAAYLSSSAIGFISSGVSIRMVDFFMASIRSSSDNGFMHAAASMRVVVFFEVSSAALGDSTVGNWDWPMSIRTVSFFSVLGWIRIRGGVDWEVGEAASCDGDSAGPPFPFKLILGGCGSRFFWIFSSAIGVSSRQFLEVK